MPPKKNTPGLTTIQYFPPDAPPTTLLLDEVVALTGMQAWADVPLLPMAKVLPSNEQKKLDALVHQSQQTQQKFALIHMPSPFQTQVEVVAAETINEGEFVLYSGDYVDTQTYVEDSYALRNGTGYVTAKQRGNMARFLSHAPSASALERELTFDPIGIKQKVATANFEGRVFEVNGVNIYALSALKTIHKGERLYWDYGLQYFVSLDFAPALFDKTKDQIVSTQFYDYKTPKVFCVRLAPEYGLSLNIIRNLIRSDSYLEFDLGVYNICFHASYWSEWLNQHDTSLSKVPFIKDYSVLYAEHSSIKRLPPGTNLEQACIDVLRRWLIDVDVKQISFIDKKQQAKEGIKPGYIGMLITKEFYARVAQTLAAKGLICKRDYVVSEGEDKKQFSVLQSALFKKISSSHHYYPDLASYLFKVRNSTARWRSEVIKDKITQQDYVSLVVDFNDHPNRAKAEQELKALVNHVDQYAASLSIEQKAEYVELEDNQAQVNIPIQVFPNIPAFDLRTIYATAPVKSAAAIPSVAPVTSIIDTVLAALNLTSYRCK